MIQTSGLLTQRLAVETYLLGSLDILELVSGLASTEGTESLASFHLIRSLLNPKGDLFSVELKDLAISRV